MNQFLVPQFIDVEPKIIGPLGMKQFIIIVIGIIIAVICYRFADLALFVVEALIITLIVVLFGFIKINGQPFHYFVLNIIKVWIGSNIRIWKKDPESKAALEKEELEKTLDVKQKENLKSSKLSELSLLLDTGGAYLGEEINSNK